MTIFSKIAAGEIPSYKCAENEQFYAFLDIDPVTKGHTLVIPRKEVDYIFDMEDEELAAFEVFAKKVARAIKTKDFQGFPGIGLALGFSGIRYYQDGDIQSLHIPVYHFP